MVAFNALGGYDMAKLLFQGHGSYRITTSNHVVIYVDPYAGSGYEEPADLILVTHQHGDHNQIHRVNKKENCIIFQNQDALKDKRYQQYNLNNITIQAVPAYNSKHDRSECVGYILSLDGLKIYATGDTSMTREMEEYNKLSLDYVLLPVDGVYNMDPEEASRCADIIDAKHAIPIHMKPGVLFDAESAVRFTAKNRLIVEAGKEIDL
jgi:L-ascorbate metabolism protein UlaG (beta-lactamase superfamily)